MMISRFGLLGAFCMSALFLVAPTKAEADNVGINVILNNAKVVKLSRPASTVIIGNPEIADATIQDAETIILTGRGFGRTNIVILDDTGTPILDERIAVSRDAQSSLRVYRRSKIENLSCEPECEASYLSKAETQSVTATRLANTAGGAAANGPAPNGPPPNN